MRIVGLITQGLKPKVAIYVYFGGYGLVLLFPKLFNLPWSQHHSRGNLYADHYRHRFYYYRVSLYLLLGPISFDYVFYCVA